MTKLNSLKPQEIEQKLRQISEQVATCPRCAALVANRTQTVFGTGSPTAEMFFVGEAPGRDEDRQGKPFVGAAGRQLNRLLEEVGIPRNDVYITNTIKCRPPNNRKPLPEEVANCRPYLNQQIDLIQPRILCALGAVAAQALLETTESLSALRGTVREYREIPVVCTYHPAYLLRNRTAKPMLLDDLRFLLEQLRKTS